MFGKNLVYGFRLYNDVCAVTCNIWQASLHLFFRSHGTPVWACFLLSSNQIESKDIKFKLKWHLYNICSGSIWNQTASVALLFQVFDYAELKGKRKRNLKPFYFAWLNLRLPPRLHVTRARPYQGGSWECWGPPWISIFETWNITLENVKWELETRWELPSVRGTGLKTGRWKKFSGEKMYWSDVQE